MPDRPDRERLSDAGAVVLAAGGSSRLGRPKQLLPFRGRPLVRVAAEAAVDAGARPVAVVTGASADEVAAAVAGLPVSTVHNPRWADGIAGSIAAGVSAVLAARPDCPAILLLACDQPLVTAQLLRDLVALRSARDAPAAAAAYAGTVGIPAVYGRAMFPLLMELKGNAGAKSILLRHRSEVATLDFPDAATDVDTAADAERLR